MSIAKGLNRKITPNMNSKGLFEVQLPFHVGSKTVYEVVAIREFPDLWAEHVDIYEWVYEPEGISREQYEQDVKDNAAIISLRSDEGILHIPDTYILSYPELGLAKYHHVVLGISLGPIHKDKNLKGLQNEVAELVSKYLGVKPKVTMHVAPMRDTLTQKEAKQLEQVREGNIRLGKTAQLSYMQERRKNQALVRQINSALYNRFKKPK